MIAFESDSPSYISDLNIDAYIASAKKSPRITSMLSEFDSIAKGSKGVPCRPVTLRKDLLSHDLLCLRFADIRKKYAGAFNEHFVASLPYILEEQCRFGAAVLRYSSYIEDRENRPLDLYTLGDASGVMARSLTDISNGSIRTLTCSPNCINENIFNKNKPEKNAYFICAPFFKVSNQYIISKKIQSFKKGFDIIFEDTTFQMYGKKRLEPIYIASQNLKNDGIFVMLEKIMQPDINDFNNRERRKDIDFKLKYFHPNEIEEKKKNIVNKMDSQLVTLDSLTLTIKKLFKNAVIFWNSCNFYTIAASNNLETLKAFIHSMTPPAIPDSFTYIELPSVIAGSKNNSFIFRKPSTT